MKQDRGRHTLKPLLKKWMPAFIYLLILMTACDQRDPRPDREVDSGSEPECRARLCPPAEVDMSFDSGVATLSDLGTPHIDGMVVEDAVPPDAAPAVCLPAPISPRGGGLSNAAIKKVISVGGPVAEDVFMATNLDGDLNGEVELIIARGGRLEVMDGTGRYWWLSDALDVRRLLDVVDLDGDGRLEIIAIATRDVLVFDGLSGDLRWSLPDDALGDISITAVTTVLIGDFTGEEIPDLYVTDSGCGAGGSGHGAVFSFSGPEFGLQLSTIDEPRRNGRCTRWHTLSDLNGDGRQEILITDGLGLSAVNALTGEVFACGTVDDAPPNGPLPILPFRDDRLGWFAFLPNQVLLMRLVADAMNTCDGDFIFEVESSSPPADGLWPRGSAIISAPQGGSPTLMTSEWSNEDNAWSVVTYTGETRRRVLIDGLLVDVQPVDANGYIHFVIQTGRDLSRHPGPRPCHLYRYAIQTAELSHLQALGRCAAIYGRRRVADRSSEFVPQITVARDGRRERVYGLTTDRNGLEHLHTVQLLVGSGPDLRRVEMPAPVGTVVATCPDQAPCALADRQVVLAYATTGGWIGLIDERLEQINEVPGSDGASTVKRPAGIATVRVVRVGDREHFAVLNQVGTLALFDPVTDTEVPVWSMELGRPARGMPIIEVAVGRAEDDLLLLRDVRQDQSGISVVDPRSGMILWTHHQPIDRIDTMRRVAFAQSSDNGTEAVLRYDRYKAGAIRPPDERCPGDLIVGDLDSRDPDCLDTPLSPLVLTALDPLTGTCLWRAVVRPTNPCTGPANQSMSVVDGSDDRGARVFITETSGLHAFSVSDGEHLAQTDLGTINGNAGRGGGVVYATGGQAPWVRVAGNGPPESYDETLVLAWRAATPDGLRSQSWAHRGALVVDDALWITPGPGWPIYRYRIADGQIIGHVALRDGESIVDAEPAGDYADVLSMVPIADLSGDGRRGVLVSTNEGMIYGLNEEGVGVWSRQHETNTGPPIVLGVDGEDRELAVPLGNGQLQLWRPEPPASPTAVWDVPCPAPPGCDPETDIDERDDLDALCAQWIPVQGVDGYEYRVIGTGGAPMTAWRTADDVSHIEGVLFGQQPGPRYRFQIRSFVHRDDERLYSNPASSDGVILRNAQAPTVEVRVEPNQLEAAVGEVSIRVIAEDDDRITGWRVDIVEANTGEHIRSLAREAILALDLDETLAWYGLDRLARPTAPGNYLVEASVVDRSGNVGVATTEVRVCDGPCR